MAAATFGQIALVLQACLFSRVRGHGWLVSPPARNAPASYSNGYCPQCGNGAGICGDGGQWPSDSNYVNFYDGPQRTFSPGEVVEVTITLTAHHKGHFEFNLCDTRVDGSAADAQACENSRNLRRVPPEESYGDCVPNDARGDCQPYMESQAERWYLPPGSGTYTMRFRLPENVQCESCTLQWRWWTANSCVPKANYGCWFDNMAQLGWDKGAWCGSYCGDCGAGSTDNVGCGEEFRNCADIAIVGEAVPGSSPSPAPASSTTPAVVATTTGAVPAPSPASASGAECVSHELLKCINGKSTYWPACDPTQSKRSVGPSGYEYGYYCTEAWTAALNEMLADPLVGRCGDTEAIHKMLAQIAYETGFYSTVYQPIDGGAGLIHMLPQSWEVNAADMDILWPGQGYVEEMRLQGKLFFQSPLSGWRSVAAWFKRTNAVIPGCGKDLFDEPFETQTRCILGRVVGRDEAFDIVGACMGEVGMSVPAATPGPQPPAPSPAPVPGSGCAAAPGSDFLGVSDDDCKVCESGYQWWPCNDDRLCTCSGERAPAPNPSPSSGCAATPGINAGVTDGDCQKCEAGYQWWPCNSDNLCTCSSP